MSEKIYHIATDIDWQSAQSIGAYRTDSLAYEGFIHCATAEQLQGVYQRYYQNQPQLWLLALVPESQSAELIYENLEGGVEKFPHLYGEISLEGVQVAPLTDSEGQITWPWGLA